MDKQDTIAVKKARKVGGSLMIPLTGFVKENAFYKIASGRDQVILTEVKL